MNRARNGIKAAIGLALALACAIGAGADEQVERRLFVTEPAGLPPADAYFVRQLCVSYLGDSSVFAVVEDRSLADALLSLSFSPAGKGWTVSASLDGVTGAAGPSTALFTLKVSAASDGALLAELLPALRKETEARLPMVAQTVREELVRRVVEQTEVRRIVSGVTVTIAALPGTVLFLAGRDPVTVPDSGKAVLADVAQRTSIVGTASLDGWFDAAVAAEVGQEDLEFAVAQEAIPRWSIRTGLGLPSILASAAGWDAIPGRLTAVLAIQHGAALNALLAQAMSGDEPLALLVSPELGALWYPWGYDSALRLGLGGYVSTRLDLGGNDPGISPARPFSAGFHASLELSTSRKFALFFEWKPALAIGSSLPPGSPDSQLDLLLSPAIAFPLGEGPVPGTWNYLSPLLVSMGAIFRF